MKHFFSSQFPPELQLLHLLKVTQLAIGQMQFLLKRCILHAFDGVFLREGQYLQSQFLEFLSVCYIVFDILYIYRDIFLLTPSAWHHPRHACVRLAAPDAEIRPWNAPPHAAPHSDVPYAWHPRRPGLPNIQEGQRVYMLTDFIWKLWRLFPPVSLRPALFPSPPADARFPACVSPPYRKWDGDAMIPSHLDPSRKVSGKEMFFKRDELSRSYHYRTMDCYWRNRYTQCYAIQVTIEE